MSPHSTILAKYQYRRQLPHLQKADATLFVTYCTHYGTLPGVARDLVLEHWLREGGIRPCGAGALAREPDGLKCGAGALARKPPRIRLLALVIMPDHVHGLLTPLRDQEGWPFPLVDILQCAKSVTAHRINRLLHRAGLVWEEESFDHILRSDESLKEKCEYIRQNPVKAGLVERAEDYPWLWLESDLR